MSFDIYDVSEYDPETARKLATEDDKVEFSLSPGELRQALMDRVRNEVQEGESYYLNLNFEPRGLTIEEEDLEDEESSRSILLDIENLIYELLDEEIDCSIWEFSNERIMVRGET